MRTVNSLRNIGFNILSQIIIIILGFITRKVFIDSLGTEYLGINGVLTNVLSMLSLVESGIGISIVYNLYKPLAIDDRPTIISLVQLYRKLYTIISIVVLGLSLLLYPFLGIILKSDIEMKLLSIYYFVFVGRNIISYLNAHKWSLINADQKGYVLSISNTIFNIIISIIKIIVLLTTSNYALFLIIDLGIYIIQNLINGRIVDKRYSYIKTKQKYKVNSEIKYNLITNTKALFFHQVGSFIVFGTDNILISSLIGTVTVGIYSNYTMIINQLTTLINQIMNGIGASIGNLVAIENSDKKYSIFKVLYLFNFWVYSIAVIFLYNLLEPFIDWWIGKGFLLDRGTFLVILLNVYLTGLRSSIGLFKDKGGIFTQDKYVPIIEGIINLFTSIVLFNYFGLIGIFLGTTVSSLTTVFWNVPRLTYKNIFHKPLIEYFKLYAYYFILTVCVGYVTTYICNNLMVAGTFMSLIIRGIICIIIPNIIYIPLFYRTDEFQYIINSLMSVIKKRCVLEKC